MGKREREGKRRNQVSAYNKTMTHTQVFVFDSKSSWYIIDSVVEYSIWLKK